MMMMRTIGKKEDKEERHKRKTINTNRNFPPVASFLAIPDLQLTSDIKRK